jgi:hypothetical protein
VGEWEKEKEKVGAVKHRLNNQIETFFLSLP